MTQGRLDRNRTLIALRLALLLLLAAMVLMPARPGPGAPVPTAEATPGSAGPAPRAFVRRTPSPPDPAELDHLAALAGTSPLFAAAPAAPELLALPPRAPRAGRNAAVDWRIRGGMPGDSVAILLADAGGLLDSARVRLDETGEAAGAFRVRPVRDGWHGWSVRVAGREAHTGAWVLPATPLRVLLAGAAGSIEAREVARALERGGARVTLAVDLGRGLPLGEAPAGLPGSAAALDSFDVVAVLAGVPVDPPEAEALLAFVRAGGGAVIAGAAAGALPGIAAGEEITLDAASLEWTAPAEFEPLPAVEASAEIVPVRPVDDRLRSAGTADDTATLVIGAYGRGRLAALGLTATWRWGLEAGRGVALAAFWTSLATWLAAGAADSIIVTAEPAAAQPGLPVEVRLERIDTAAAPPASIHVRFRGGRSDSLPVAWMDDRGTARFVAPGHGIAEIRLAADGPPVAGHLADSLAPPAAGAWARLAGIADASGGGLVPADSIDALLPAPAGRLLRPLLAAAIVLLAITEWAARRLRGRA